MLDTTTQISGQDDILSAFVSFQKNAWSQLSGEIKIKEVLDDIKSEKHKSTIEPLRSLLSKGDIDGYNRHKKNLPAVTFCGRFEGQRKREFLNIYNSLIVLDIDNLDKSKLESLKEVFMKDEYIFSFWESPSQA